MSTVFLVMVLIFVALIALIVWAATNNRQTYYQPGPTYVEPGVVIVEDDTPLIAGMVAADIASDIAFGAVEGAMMSNQGQYFDNQNSGFGGYDFSGGNDFGGGNDFMGGDSGFDSSSGGFDSGGGSDF